MQWMSYACQVITHISFFSLSLSLWCNQLVKGGENVANVRDIKLDQKHYTGDIWYTYDY